MRNIHHAFQFPVHWHEEIEIIYVKEGKLHVKIGEQDMDGEAGDLFFVNPRELHLMSSSDGKVKYYRVHRLVAQNFLPYPTSGQTQVEHIDGNRQNNYVKCEIIDGNIYVHRDETNIRWTTPKGNMANEITRLRISIANSNPSEETRRRMSEGQKRRFARERATKTGRYAESNN